MPDYVIYCIDHDVPLNEDGTCRYCRDSKGRPFILDMQSTYLISLSVIERLADKYA